jgi:hypothetical protein
LSLQAAAASASASNPMAFETAETHARKVRKLAGVASSLSEKREVAAYVSERGRGKFRVLSWKPQARFGFIPCAPRPSGLLPARWP